MDEAIIALWNETIKPEDTVYILGDFCWGTAKMWETYLPKMKGHKVLIIGNHDLKRMSSTTKKYFDNIQHYLEINDGDYHIIMSHYPILTYNGSYRENVIMLFGHVHNNTDESHTVEHFIKEIRDSYDGVKHINRGNLINVGCMMPWMNYIPRTINELIEKLNSGEMYK